jgi:DedD protein
LTETQDATLLQRRARRRLVGAIALVVLIVIALPIVLDQEPGPVSQELVIQIPSQEAGKFKTPVLPPPAQDSTARPTPGTVAEKQSPAAKSEAVAPETVARGPENVPAAGVAKAPLLPAVPAGSSAGPKERPQAEKGDPEGARVQALLEGKEAWVVPLGAFSSPENVKQLQDKLAAADMKSYTESVRTQKGQQTRVRAGPYDSKAAAEKARQKLTEMGLHPAAVTAR